MGTLKAWVAASMVGILSGAAGAGLVVLMRGVVDWQAIGALTTLAAVLVALWPIWRDEERRKQQARVLRLQLLTHLTSLRPTFGRPGQRPHARPNDPLTEDERRPIMALGALIPQAHLLGPAEYASLARTYANLVLTAQPNIPLAQPQQMLALIDETLTLLDQGDLLPQQPTPPPWV